MLDENTAKAIVVDFLATLPRRDRHDRWVVSRVEDCGDFWLFHWTTHRNLPPRNLKVALAGNYPIGVRKSDGVACIWTMLFPFEQFADKLVHHPEQLPQLPKKE